VYKKRKSNNKKVIKLRNIVKSSEKKKPFVSATIAWSDNLFLSSGNCRPKVSSIRLINVTQAERK